MCLWNCFLTDFSLCLVQAPWCLTHYLEKLKVKVPFPSYWLSTWTASQFCFLFSLANCFLVIVCSWVEFSLSLHSASRAITLSIVQTFIPFDIQSIFGSAPDRHDLPRTWSYAVQSTLYVRTVTEASPTCMNSFLVNCCTATSVPSQRSAFRLLFFLRSFSLSANCFAAKISSHPLSIKILKGKSTPLSWETFPLWASSDCCSVRLYGKNVQGFLPS